MKVQQIVQWFRLIIKGVARLFSTFKEIAETLGVAIRTVREWFRGKRKPQARHEIESLQIVNEHGYVMERWDFKEAKQANLAFLPYAKK